MIQKEYPYLNDTNLVRFYSDIEGAKLYQNETGIIYEEAVDKYPSKFTYTEILPEELEGVEDGEINDGEVS